MITVDSIMNSFTTKFCIVAVTLGLIFVSSYAMISYSQSNDTVSDDLAVDESITNESSFSILSRELANQSDSDRESDDDE